MFVAWDVDTLLLVVDTVVADVNVLVHDNTHVESVILVPSQSLIQVDVVAAAYIVIVLFVVGRSVGVVVVAFVLALFCRGSF